MYCLVSSIESRLTRSVFCDVPTTQHLSATTMLSLCGHGTLSSCTRAATHIHTHKSTVCVPVEPPVLSHPSLSCRRRASGCVRRLLRLAGGLRCRVSVRQAGCCGWLAACGAGSQSDRPAAAAGWRPPVPGLSQTGRLLRLAGGLRCRVSVRQAGCCDWLAACGAGSQSDRPAAAAGWQPPVPGLSQTGRLLRLAGGLRCRVSVRQQVSRSSS